MKCKYGLDEDCETCVACGPKPSATSAGYDRFEPWLRTVCFQAPTKEAYELAKAAWNEAIKGAMPLSLEKQYAERLGRLAQLCDTVIPWLQGAMSGVNDSDIPAEVRAGITEIMDYVDAVRP